MSIVYVSQLSRETLAKLTSPPAYVGQLTAETLAKLTTQSAYVGQLATETLTLRHTVIAHVSGLFIEVLVPYQDPVVAPPIFPAVPGLGWPMTKSPGFSTDESKHASGISIRRARRPWPIWNFVLNFEGLASDDSYLGLGDASLQSVMGFITDMQGQYGAFLVQDPTDCQVTAGPIGIGDGATRTFLLTRTLGTVIAEPVGWVLPGGLTNVYVNGTALSPSGWTLSQPNQVVLTAPPAADAVVTADFTFYFQCAFAEDSTDFDEFMENLWEKKELKIRSLISALGG